jgi:hypothetical protein
VQLCSPALLRIATVALVSAASPPRCAALTGGAVFPRSNWWNLDISQAPLDPGSAALHQFHQRPHRVEPDRDAAVHPDFGPSPYGIPYVVVSGDQPLVRPTWTAYGDESDEGAPGRPLGYPIPERGEDPGQLHRRLHPRRRARRRSTSAHHRPGQLAPLRNRRDYWNAAANRWEANAARIFDLNRNDRRPETWTSADAAGLAIFRGLVRYDEAYGTAEITHAFRVTVRATNGYVWPASQLPQRARRPGRCRWARAFG